MVAVTVRASASGIQKTAKPCNETVDSWSHKSSFFGTVNAGTIKVVSHMGLESQHKNRACNTAGLAANHYRLTLIAERS